MVLFNFLENFFVHFNLAWIDFFNLNKEADPIADDKSFVVKLRAGINAKFGECRSKTIPRVYSATKPITKYTIAGFSRSARYERAKFELSARSI